MVTDALNPMRSLYAPATRLDDNRPAAQDDNGLVENGNGLGGTSGVSFLDALSWGQGGAATSLPGIDGQPVEKSGPTPNGNIFSTLEARDDNVDPQILLTQKLADSLMKGLLNTYVSDKDAIPTELARPT